VVISKASIGDPAHDVSIEDIHIKYDQLLATEGGAVYRKHRPRHCRGYVSKAPKVGDAAPDGVLHTLDGIPTTLYAELKALGTARPQGSPTHVAVVFGSRTCPVWTGVTAQLALRAFGKQLIPSVQIYTREAAPSDLFPNQMNERVGIKINEHKARCFHLGFCCVRVSSSVGLRLLHGALFQTNNCTRGRYWFSHLL
jgi:hypothetical protein